MRLLILLSARRLTISILSLFARFNAIVNSRKKEIGLGEYFKRYFFSVSLCMEYKDCYNKHISQLFAFS